MIPDISGFTHFVHETELKHSVHIVAEILEEIILNNNLNLKVAEIEGDAVFFYRKGPKPTTEEVYQQIKAIYLAFHQLIERYKRDRVCDCGACSTAHNLQIKFVAHYGRTIERTIVDHQQLMGPDVTLVHKLLKNKVKGNEYFLWVDGTLQNNDHDSKVWKSLHAETTSYDGIGQVDYQCVFLDPLKDDLPKIAPRKQMEAVEDPITFTFEVNADLQTTYDTITNLDYRAQWLGQVDKLKYNEERVHRIGSTHECVLPTGNLHFETIEDSQTKDQKIYTEFSTGSFITPPFYENYIIDKIDDQHCHVTASLHVHGNKLQKVFFRSLIAKGYKKAMQRFKALSEENFNLQTQPQLQTL